jgi:hypothetical protein
MFDISASGTLSPPAKTGGGGSYLAPRDIVSLEGGVINNNGLIVIDDKLQQRNLTQRFGRSLRTAIAPRLQRFVGPNYTQKYCSDRIFAAEKT